MAPTAASIDEYISTFPEATQEILQELRRHVLAALPDAEERISYQIPTFAVDGQYVIYIAGWKNHVSIYPIPGGDEELDADLEPYLSGQGTIKLPLEATGPVGPRRPGDRRPGRGARAADPALARAVRGQESPSELSSRSPALFMCRSIADAAASAFRAAMASAIDVCSASVRLVCATSFTARSTQTRISDRTVVSRSVSSEFPAASAMTWWNRMSASTKTAEVVAVLPHGHERVASIASRCSSEARSAASRATWTSSTWRTWISSTVFGSPSQRPQLRVCGSSSETLPLR